MTGQGAGEDAELKEAPSHKDYDTIFNKEYVMRTLGRIMWQNGETVDEKQTGSKLRTLGVGFVDAPEPQSLGAQETKGANNEEEHIETSIERNCDDGGADGAVGPGGGTKYQGGTLIGDRITTETQTEIPKNEQKREAGGAMLDWVYDKLTELAKEGGEYCEQDIEEDLVSDMWEAVEEWKALGVAGENSDGDLAWIIGMSGEVMQLSYKGVKSRDESESEDWEEGGETEEGEEDEEDHG